MKLLKTLLVALIGIALFNCTAEKEDQVQKIEAAIDLKQAKSTFELSYSEHINFVLKKANQLQRKEIHSLKNLQPTFEDQWLSLKQNLSTLTTLMDENETVIYLTSIMSQYGQPSIVATPCYDAYIHQLNEATLDAAICLLTAYIGGDSPAMCSGNYLNQIRRAYNDYNSCLEKEYGEQSGLE